MSLETGFEVGFRGVVGAGFPAENEGKGEGGGEGGKELASQCADLRQNYPLANYPLAPPREFLTLAHKIVIQACWR